MKKSGLPRPAFNIFLGFLPLANLIKIFFNSKGEARRAINQNAISVNQAKVTLDYFIGIEDLIANQYVLLQRGKKNYFVIKVND